MLPLRQSHKSMHIKQVILLFRTVFIIFNFIAFSIYKIYSTLSKKKVSLYEAPTQKRIESPNTASPPKSLSAP